MYVSPIHVGPTCMGPTPNVSWSRLVNQSDVEITHSQNYKPTKVLTIEI
jgi:hypothetical protein